MFETSSPLSRHPDYSFSSTISSISLYLSDDGSFTSLTPSFWCRRRTMNLVQQCARRLKDLVYECQKRRGPNDDTVHYRDAESIIAQLLHASFSEEGQRLQISSGVVVDLAQLLVLDVFKWQSTQLATHQPAINLRHQIAQLLVNLTCRSPDCKKLLCLEENFFNSVSLLLTVPTLVKDYSDIIRNIAWKADREIGHYLLVTVRPLADASVKISSCQPPNSAFSSSRSSNNSISNDDKTLKSIYSALWNLAIISNRCCEEMCAVANFLNCLIHWLTELDRSSVLIEQVVGLSKCLINQIYKSPDASLRVNYVASLMGLVAVQSAQPNIGIIRNVLHSLWLAIQYKNDNPTKTVFFKTNRFKHDLQQLLQKKELDKLSRDRIQTLLQHVSYCSGLLEGASNSPHFVTSQFHSPSFAPTPTYAQTLSVGPTTRPNMPLTSLLSPHSTLHSRPFHKNQPLTTPVTLNITPTSQDSLPSSADSKLGFNTRRYEDMKSSGYSETSMGSENFQQYMSHMSKFKSEYAEPKKQAHIRNLNTQQHAWHSPNSSNHSGLYENQRVIENSVNENCQASTSQDQQNHYQNYEDNYFEEDKNEAYYMGMDRSQYESQGSLFCYASSQHPSLTSLSTMPVCPSEKISPRSVNLSPINEDELNASDSASQRGILIEKNNGSSNTTPRTTMTNNSTVERQKNNENELRPEILAQNLLNFPKLSINSEMYRKENKEFNQSY